MTNYTSATTINGLTLTAGSSPAPSAVPTGLIATRAVQVKGGWVGQVVVAEEIIWETPARASSSRAEEEATKYVIVRIKGLLTKSAPKAR